MEGFRRKEMQGGVSKIIRKISEEIILSIEILEHPFRERTRYFLRAGKVIAMHDASVKNGLMGECWAMKRRKNEELMNH